ncbi:hypothetical protein RZS08_12630, partial [Arthrospira platensis SPKY1]|nr:hypothetical protein [Arthrospira platensis SPKY1]
LGADVIESGHPAQIAQHAQHFPGRTGLAQRLAGSLEALPAAFGVDVGSGGFGEGRHRQQKQGADAPRSPDAGVIPAASAGVGRERHHEFGALEGLERRRAIPAVEFGLDPQQHISLARRFQHRPRIQTDRRRLTARRPVRQGSDQPASCRIGGFRQITEPGA